MKRKVDLKNVRGSYDYDPQEQRIRNHIQDTLRDLFESYSYKPLETPILCYYDLLAGKYDESNDLLNEIYKLSDQGERELGLRYDLTVPFAKFISISKNLRLPFKRFEIGKVFRDGPVKAGRDREFLQCDVDVVGLSGSAIEAELLSLWLTGYKRLGIDVYIKYNSRNLLCGLIKEVAKVEDDELSSYVTVIDKMDKLSKDELIGELLKLGLQRNDALELLSYFELDLNGLKEKFLSQSNEMLINGLNEVCELERVLESVGIKNETVFTPCLARGQDYYTGNVFEVYAKNGELTCSLGGGGRYDRMITDFIDDGNLYPAVGVSFGLSTIYEILKNREEAYKPFVDVLIVPMATEGESIKLANEIRELGLKVEVDLTKRKLKRSFEFADKENIPYVVVLGEDELNNKTFKIKSMCTSEEREISLDDVSTLKDIIDL